MFDEGAGQYGQQGYLSPPPPSVYPTPSYSSYEQGYSPNISQAYLPPPPPPPPLPVYPTPAYPSYEQKSSYVPTPILPPAYLPPPPPPPPLPPALPPPLPQYSAPIIGGGGSYSTAFLANNPLINRYSIAELATFLPLANYRQNHWSLLYYRASPYKICQRGSSYLGSPTYKDIEAAFIYANQQLAYALNTKIQYLNSTTPSFAARHQIFSYLTQQNARMDEEGLLVEFVSQYLADRGCMTKWDKQRYLPQLTKLISTSNFPGTHSCSNYYQLKNQWQGSLQYCVQSKYRSYDGFCNNPWHPYWGKSNVCHIRLLSPDYADGISLPRNSYNPRYPLPNPRLLSNLLHNDIPLEGPYNLMKMQWGQFINHDITNTALSTYEGLVDCCKNPQVRGCLPIYVPPGDKFYSSYNVTCLNFIRSGVCPLCQLGPRQQLNKNTAFLDASQVYGNTPEEAYKVRLFRGGLLKTSVGKNGEILLPFATGPAQEQCSGTCFLAGDSRVNQHPALTALHTLLLRSHNLHALKLAIRHPNYNDEILFQEARRIVIAEYQMITYGEYLPIVFGPILSSYYRLIPQRNTSTYYEPKADPTTWNEYATATCRFGHSQIQSFFGLYSRVISYGQQQSQQPTFRLKDWFMRPSLLSDGLLNQIVNGLISRPSMAVDPWITNDVRNHLYQSTKEYTGGDLAATNIWRAREHGIPGYIHYLEYCFNFKVRNWRDLAVFIPQYTLANLRKAYRVPENIDLFTGGMAERHFPGADIGPTFACVNGIQYYHLKFGDRYYFEHANQAGSFNYLQLEEIKRTTLARLLCRTAYLQAVPQYAFLQASIYNPLVNCSLVGELNYNLF